MQVFFTAKRLNIFCCHNPNRKRPEFQVGSIRYWWIRVFRQILHAQTFKCFIYNIHLLFINMQLWWITGNTTLWYSNPVWLLGLRLILCFAGLEVRVEAVPTECQYFQTAKRVANGVIFHPLCSVETPLKVLRRSIFFFFFFENKDQDLYCVLCIQLPILKNLNQFLWQSWFLLPCIRRHDTWRGKWFHWCSWRVQTLNLI